MVARAASAPLTPAQAVAAGRKALLARRAAEARARRPKWFAPVVVETTVVRVSAPAPDRWPRCWAPPRVTLDVADAAYREGFAAGRRAEESGGAWERGEPSPINPPPSAGEGVEPPSTPPQAAATGSGKLADLSTEPRAEPEPGAQCETACNGLWGKPGLIDRLRDLWTSSGRSAADIAAELSEIAGRQITRDAVLGKVHRLGLTRSAPPPVTGPAKTEGAAGRDKRGAQHADASLRAIRARAAKRAPKVRLAGDGEATLAPVRESAALQSPTCVKRSADSAVSIFAPAEEVGKIDMAFGAYRLADLRESQCRFACTDDRARPEDHRFCGRPTRVGRGNLHGSWCEEHLARVWGRGSEGERNAARVLRRYG